MSLTVECKTRTVGSKSRALRREGLIPAALYGHKGAESISLTMNAKEAQTLLKKAAVNNTLVDLNIPDIPWSGKAIIREVQAHPWKRTLYHLSFFSAAGDKKLNLVVPIKLLGEAKGIKQGGILEQIFTELHISCAANKIPEHIDVDVSNFEIGTNLTVGDVVLPEGVTVLDDAEQTLFSIVAPAKLSLSDEGETEEMTTEE
ncbi:ribosomal protein L25, Ctc-form [Xenococcus sp. PCC 7305]|uniref:50S ribosomal protein L25/general stress protein Ctc n=1 Tax=Xenococcus sp. PCC 7305 TaxID=102125 RepID=UPI0002ABF819|nr:50S ribosomal protein L25/general stress protein Ctc [Xenococcus sp. PCC 7305]ELS01285.1 ribosomal protein L25, Ctc-form [Xenococcus sp. PCC 7305]